MSDPRQKILSSLSYGLYVVTSRNRAGKLNGQISDALMQVTGAPPRIAVAINKTELTHDFLMETGAIGVSVLGMTATLEHVGLFGFKSGRDIDKLVQVDYRVGKTGAPMVFDHAVAVFEGTVIQKHDVGTHMLFVADVLDGEPIPGEPMTYRHYQTALKGKVPPNSPSYPGEAAQKNRVSLDLPATGSGDRAAPETPGGGKYVCNSCGWIYDPADGEIGRASCRERV